MSSTLPVGGPLRARPFAGADPSWLLAPAGFAAMYLPVHWAAATGIWQTDDNAHGALILAVVAWLFWTVRRPLADAPTAQARIPSALLLGLGLAVYFVGRVADVLMLAIASQPLVVADVMHGVAGIVLQVALLVFFAFDRLLERPLLPRRVAP